MGKPEGALPPRHEGVETVANKIAIGGETRGEPPRPDTKGIKTSTNKTGTTCNQGERSRPDTKGIETQLEADEGENAVGERSRPDTKGIETPEREPCPK